MSRLPAADQRYSVQATARTAPYRPRKTPPATRPRNAVAPADGEHTRPMNRILVPAWRVAQREHADVIRLRQDSHQVQVYGNTPILLVRAETGNQNPNVHLPPI